MEEKSSCLQRPTVGALSSVLDVLNQNPLKLPSRVWGFVMLLMCQSCYMPAKLIHWLSIREAGLVEIGPTYLLTRMDNPCLRKNSRSLSLTLPPPNRVAYGNLF